MSVFKNLKSWLLPAMLILFLSEVILFPFAIQNTYAGREEAPNHLLTYTSGNLKWNTDTDVDQNGSAILNIFSKSYDNVNTSDDSKIVAPGTENKNIVRLKNDCSNTIEYTAVLYNIKNEDLLPVNPTFAGDEYNYTTEYSLPDNIDENHVVCAVTGKLNSGEIQDFDIEWKWNFYDSEQRDIIDTKLGDKAAYFTADEVTTGVYIFVSENENYVYPRSPDTSDINNIKMYLALMAVSGIILALFFLDLRKENKCRNS